MFRHLLFIVTLAMLTACSPSSNLPLLAKDLPSGDVTRGMDLFKQPIDGAPACTSCHTVDGTALVGPSFQGFGTAAGTRISGSSAAEYTYQSIVHPAAYIVSGYSNLMYGQYAQHLNAQQIADLTTYLLSR